MYSTSSTGRSMLGAVFASVAFDDSPDQVDSQLSGEYTPGEADGAEVRRERILPPQCANPAGALRRIERQIEIAQIPVIGTPDRHDRRVPGQASVIETATVLGMLARRHAPPSKLPRRLVQLLHAQPAPRDTALRNPRIAGRRRWLREAVARIERVQRKGSTESGSDLSVTEGSMDCLQQCALPGMRRDEDHTVHLRHVQCREIGGSPSGRSGDSLVSGQTRLLDVEAEQSAAARVAEQDNVAKPGGAQESDAGRDVIERELVLEPQVVPDTAARSRDQAANPAPTMSGMK